MPLETPTPRRIRFREDAEKESPEAKRTAATGTSASSSSAAPAPLPVPTLPVQAEGDSHDWSVDDDTGEWKEDKDENQSDSEDKDKANQDKLEMMSYAFWTTSQTDGWTMKTFYQHQTTATKAKGPSTLSRHSLNNYRQQKLRQYRQLYTDQDFEFFHAIADAEKLMQQSCRDRRAELPWSRSDSMIVMETPFDSRCFYYDLQEDRCYSVSSDELLTPEDVARYWPAVEKADREEVESFVKHQIFRLDARCREGVDNIVDGIWIRKWKSREQKIVKSRC